jgi:hypothetical protein
MSGKKGNLASDALRALAHPPQVHPKAESSPSTKRIMKIDEDEDNPSKPSKLRWDQPSAEASRFSAALIRDIT